MKIETRSLFLIFLFISQLPFVSLAQSNSETMSTSSRIESLLNLINPEEQALQIYQFLNQQSSDEISMIFDKYHFHNSLQFRIVSLAFHRKNFQLLTEFKKSGYNFLTMDTNRPLICEMIVRMTPEFKDDVVIDELISFKDNLDPSELENDCDGTSFQKIVEEIKSQKSEVMLAINKRFEWAQQEKEDLKSISESVHSQVTHSIQFNKIVTIGPQSFQLALKRARQCSPENIQYIQNYIAAELARISQLQAKSSVRFESQDSSIENCPFYMTLQRIPLNK